MNNLAVTLQMAGRYPEAVRLARGSVAAAEGQAAAPIIPSRSPREMSLGQAYQYAGDLERAIAAHRGGEGASSGRRWAPTTRTRSWR